MGADAQSPHLQGLGRVLRGVGPLSVPLVLRPAPGGGGRGAAHGSDDPSRGSGGPQRGGVHGRGGGVPPAVQRRGYDGLHQLLVPPGPEDAVHGLRPPG